VLRTTIKYNFCFMVIPSFLNDTLFYLLYYKTSIAQPLFTRLYNFLTHPVLRLVNKSQNSGLLQFGWRRGAKGSPFSM
jgi:hypothetical protein